MIKYFLVYFWLLLYNEILLLSREFNKSGFDNLNKIYDLYLKLYVKNFVNYNNAACNAF